MGKAQKSSRMGMCTLAIISMENLKAMVNTTGRISHPSKATSSNFEKLLEGTKNGYIFIL